MCHTRTKPSSSFRIALYNGSWVTHAHKTAIVASNNTKTLVAQVATCSVPAGWMTVPNATKANPKPQDGWSVVATYNGNSSFFSSSASKRGTAKY